MDRERAAELLPIITAFAEGKTIESSACYSTEWGEVTTTHWHDDCEFRIKAEPREWYLCWDGSDIRPDPKDVMAYPIPAYDGCLDHWTNIIKVREVL